MKDKTGVKWGRKHSGDHPSIVKTALVGVAKIWLTDYAFSAVLKDTTEVTWGVKFSDSDSGVSWNVKTILNGIGVYH